MVVRSNSPSLPINSPRSPPAFLLPPSLLSLLPCHGKRSHRCEEALAAHAGQRQAVVVAATAGGDAARGAGHRARPHRRRRPPLAQGHRLHQPPRHHEFHAAAVRDGVAHHARRPGVRRGTRRRRGRRDPDPEPPRAAGGARVPAADAEGGRPSPPRAAPAGARRPLLRRPPLPLPPIPPPPLSILVPLRMIAQPSHCIHQPLIRRRIAKRFDMHSPERKITIQIEKEMSITSNSSSFLCLFLISLNLQLLCDLICAGAISVASHLGQTRLRRCPPIRPLPPPVSCSWKTILVL
ncbi:hypothetical protein MUK42_06170 [Musa troglodytarum]|uniref:Uncharacterized protein n=1 Tax=Musa troglodytarum TaxID=320322 RepID=A0A9E7HH92_9LILI|nr:hypothetical protein MUK42_06170 [Musa troglodytarum]